MLEGGSCGCPRARRQQRRAGGRWPGGPGRLQGAQCPLTRLFPYLAAPLPASRPPEPGQAENRPKLTQGQARVPARLRSPKGRPAGDRVLSRAGMARERGSLVTQSAVLLGRSLGGGGDPLPEQTVHPHPALTTGCPSTPAVPSKSSQPKTEPPQHPGVILTPGILAAAQPPTPATEGGPQPALPHSVPPGHGPTTTFPSTFWGDSAALAQLSGSQDRCTPATLSCS